MNRNYIIAIAGGSGSGKTTLAKKLCKIFSNNSKLNILGQDSYYIDQSENFDKDGGSVNFDHPDALEFSLMGRHIQSLKEDSPIEVPIYDFATHKRLSITEKFLPSEMIFVEGTLLYSQPELHHLFDEMIFLEVEESLRYRRRLKRDTEERGRTEEGVYNQFYKQVKPMHDQFVEPSKHHASLILQEDHLIITQRPASRIRAEVLEALKLIMSTKS